MDAPTTTSASSEGQGQQWQLESGYQQPYLSLNLSSLSVASPNNLSPIGNASTATSGMSPVTPISPAQTPFAHHYMAYPPPQPPQASLNDDRSRSSSISEKSSVPRKRSFSAATPLAPPPPHHQYADEVDMNGSPIDGSDSGQDDHMRGVVEPTPPPSSHSIQQASMGVIGSKPMTTNNFVTKLYQYVRSLRTLRSSCRH